MTERGRQCVDERSWYALYTRPKFEKKVVSILTEKQIESFLPTRSVIRFWSDRKKMIQEPLFPSYVFVFADQAERYRSLQSVGVIRMVHFNGKPARIPSAQIENIRRALNNGYQLEPHDHYLHSGDEVEIVAGPLSGMRGYFLENRGNKKLVISVHAIQQSLVIELDPGQIKKSPSRNISLADAAT
ncbi:MAG: UpxY family transcription antiterminator [bacterium]